MAQNFLTSINLNKNELQNAVIQPLAVSPSNPNVGQVYYNAGTIYVCTVGGATPTWKPLSGDIEEVIAGSGLTGGGTSGSVTLSIATNGVVTTMIADSNVTLSKIQNIASNTILGNNTGGAAAPIALTASQTRSLLSLVVGTDVQAWDADLDAIAALTGTSGFLKKTAANTWSLDTNSYVNKAGDTMTGYLTLSGDPVNDLHAATKQYVDAVATGLDIKGSVKVATTANITLSGTQTIDGVAVIASDRVLVKNQSTTSQNGIYVVSAGAWTRSSDMDAWSEVPGAFTFVEQGSTQADTGWVCTSDQGGVLGTTAINWSQFSGAGTYTAGTGLTLSGNQFSITNTSVSAGSYGSSIQVGTFTVNAQGQLTAAGNTTIRSASESQTGVVELATSAETTTGTSTTLATHPAGVKAAIDNALAESGYAANLGNGSSTSYVINHNLGTRDVIVQVYDSATYDTVYLDVVRTDANNVTLTFAVAPASNAYRVVVQRVA